MSAWVVAVVTGLAAALPVVGVGAVARRADRDRARDAVAVRLTATDHDHDPAPPRPSSATRRLTGRWERWWSRRRWRRELPLALESVARELRAGAPLSMALVDGVSSVGGPVASDATWLRRRLDAGQQVAEVVRWWAARRAAPELEPFAVLCATGSRLGGGLVEAVDGLAASMQDRREVAADAAAASAQARASALMLVAAPAVFLLVMSGIEPAATRFLFATPGGWLVLGLAVALDGAGAWWMHRLTDQVR